MSLGQDTCLVQNALKINLRESGVCNLCMYLGQDVSCSYRYVYFYTSRFAITRLYSSRAFNPCLISNRIPPISIPSIKRTPVMSILLMGAVALRRGRLCETPENSNLDASPGRRISGRFGCRALSATYSGIAGIILSIGNFPGLFSGTRVFAGMRLSPSFFRGCEYMPGQRQTHPWHFRAVMKKNVWI